MRIPFLIILLLTAHGCSSKSNHDLAEFENLKNTIEKLRQRDIIVKYQRLDEIVKQGYWVEPPFGRHLDFEAAWKKYGFRIIGLGIAECTGHQLNDGDVELLADLPQLSSLTLNRCTTDLHDSNIHLKELGDAEFHGKGFGLKLVETTPTEGLIAACNPSGLFAISLDADEITIEQLSVVSKGEKVGSMKIRTKQLPAGAIERVARNGRLIRFTVDATNFSDVQLRRLGSIESLLDVRFTTDAIFDADMLQYAASVTAVRSLECAVPEDFNRSDGKAVFADWHYVHVFRDGKQTRIAANR